MTPLKAAALAAKARREALRREVVQNTARLRTTPARGSEGRKGAGVF